MRRIIGQIEVDNGVRIKTSTDFCFYYKKLIEKARPGIRVQIPKHKAHVTLYNPKLHGKKDLALVKHLHGKQVGFTYNPEKVFISKVNFWFPVWDCATYKEIKSILRFRETKEWRGLHITVCNKKFNNERHA